MAGMKAVGEYVGLATGTATRSAMRPLRKPSPHALAIKSAHAALSKRPGFKAQAPHVQFQAAQAHVKATKGRV